MTILILMLLANIVAITAILVSNNGMESAQFGYANNILCGFDFRVNDFCLSWKVFYFLIFLRRFILFHGNLKWHAQIFISYILKLLKIVSGVE